MKALLLNGSPRKNWNTHKMLLEAERGAKEIGAETELIHLFDLKYTDCKSCFACKLKNNKTSGICAVRDDLRPVLEKAAEADVVIIGSPIYYGNLTGQTLAFINRFLFASAVYENDPATGKARKQLPGTKKCGLIVTMNAGQAAVNGLYGQTVGTLSWTIGHLMGSCETVYACDTYQFSDYNKYYAGMWDERHKAEVREKQFPIDLQNAYELGKRLCQ